MVLKDDARLPNTLCTYSCRCIIFDEIEDWWTENPEWLKLSTGKVLRASTWWALGAVVINYRYGRSHQLPRKVHSHTRLWRTPSTKQKRNRHRLDFIAKVVAHKSWTFAAWKAATSNRNMCRARWQMVCPMRAESKNPESTQTTIVAMVFRSEVSMDCGLGRFFSLIGRPDNLSAAFAGLHLRWSWKVLSWLKNQRSVFFLHRKQSRQRVGFGPVCSGTWAVKWKVNLFVQKQTHSAAG